MCSKSRGISLADDDKENEKRKRIIYNKNTVYKGLSVAKSIKSTYVKHGKRKRTMKGEFPAQI